MRVGWEARVERTKWGLEVQAVCPGGNRSQVNMGVKAGHIKRIDTMETPSGSRSRVLRNQHTARIQGPFMGVGEQQRLKQVENVRQLQSLLRKPLLYLFTMAWDRLPGFSNLVAARKVGQSQESCHRWGAEVRPWSPDDSLIGGIMTVIQCIPVMCVVPF